MKLIGNSVLPACRIKALPHINLNLSGKTFSRPTSQSDAWQHGSATKIFGRNDHNQVFMKYSRCNKYGIRDQSRKCLTGGTGYSNLK